MMTMKAFRRAMLAGVSVAGVMAGAGAAQATEHLIYTSGDLALSWMGNVGAGAFYTPNSNFGVGTTSFDGNDFTTHPMWGEGWVKPELKLTYHTSSGTLFADVNGILAGTVGSGEAESTAMTSGNPFNFSLEEAYLGYTGDLPLHEGDTFTVQLGRQNFAIDDGFLMQDGTLDTGGRGAYYTAPRTAFDGFGVVKLNSTPVRGDVFVLRSTYDKNLTRGGDGPRRTFAGFDVEWFKDAAYAGADGGQNYGDRDKYVNLTYFNVIDSSYAGYTGNYFGYDGKGSVQGLNVLSLAVGGHVLPASWGNFASNFTFYGQYVAEFRNAAYGASAINANAWYVEPGYKFDKLPWQPKVYYRYTHFSGQDTASTDQTAYNPFFYGTGNRASFGAWFLGEIVGVYDLFNSNENVNQVGVVLSPTFHLIDKVDSTTIDLLFYHFDLDKAAPGTPKNFADEVDVVAEYSRGPLYAALAAGVAVPHSGATNYWSSVSGTPANKTSGILESYFVLQF